MSYETHFLIALLGTEAIEIPIVIILVRHIFRIKRLKISDVAETAFLASFMTLPYLWFVMPEYLDPEYATYIGELIVFVFEALLYYYILRPKLFTAFTISFIANLVSYLAGYYLFSFVL